MSPGDADYRVIWDGGPPHAPTVVGEAQTADAALELARNVSRSSGRVLVRCPDGIVIDADTGAVTTPSGDPFAGIESYAESPNADPDAAVDTIRVDMGDGSEEALAAAAEAVRDALTERVAEVIDRVGQDKVEPLFDPHAYADERLDLRTRDGRLIDAITVVFTGTVELRRGDYDHVRLWQSLLRLGRDVTLTVRCRVAGEPVKETPATDKSPALVVAGKTLRVHNIITNTKDP